MVGEPDGYRRLLEEVAALYDWIEMQLDQIKQLGLQNYLVEQME